MNGRAMFAFVIPLDGTPVDPGYGQSGWSPVDPGYGHGFVPVDPGYGHGHPLPPHLGNALPVPPLRPSTPIVLPPGIWPPSLPPNALPPGIDNSLPPEASNKPIVIPPDPGLGIELPIVIPPLPAGVALLIALSGSANVPTPTGTPPGTKPAILVQSGKKPVLVFVTAAPPTAAPKS
jgi:hypothetical protein